MNALRNTRIRLAAMLAALGVMAMGALLVSCAPSHEEESVSASSSTRTLACIGDSITYGHGLADPATEAWPALMQAELGGSWNVENLGVSGTTLSDEGGFPYRSTGNVERAKAIDPHVATIMLGTNDAADPSWNVESYRNQLRALIDELVAASSHDVRIVLMAPPCTFFTSRNPGVNERIADEVRPVVESVAAEKGVRYVDLFALTKDHPEWFPDELHPNEAGARAIADYLLVQLSDLGRR